MSKSYKKSEYLCSVELPNWKNLYPLVRLELFVENWVNQKTFIQSLIPGCVAHIDVYWRALDWYLGDNTDRHTLCYILVQATSVELF